MSGHSKWSQIKHKKAISDVKKGRVASKISTLISIAAREGGGDPNMNSRLRTEMEKAKSWNISSDVIKKAIDRGLGKIASQTIEEVVYEAIAPGNTSLIIKAATDNKNRTLGEIRQILNDAGGKLAEPGSLKWNFENKTKLIFEPLPAWNEEMDLKTIELGAEDIRKQGNEIIIFAKSPATAQKIKTELENLGFTLQEMSHELVAKNLIKVSDKEVRDKIARLFEILDDHPDVEDFYSNAEF